MRGGVGMAGRTGRLGWPLALGGAMVVLVLALAGVGFGSERRQAAGESPPPLPPRPDPVRARVAAAGLPPQVAEAILVEARRHGIDPRLVMAVIEVESGWNPEARNGESLGLMQVSPPAMEDMVRRGVAGGDLRDPVVNVRVGTAYLAWLMRRYPGDLAMALTAYNQGPSRAERWREETGSGESLYSSRVIAAMGG